MAAAPAPQLARTWSSLDFGLHAFLAINPLVLGLWAFSFAPIVGGNLFLAVVLAGAVTLVGAVVIGTLAVRWPWTGGDYAWQTRLLNARIGAVLALTSWWLVVAVLAPVYGNAIVVLVLDPSLTHSGWDGLRAWFHGREGTFVASLSAITVATTFVGLGMRRAAIAQRILVAIGIAAFVAVVALLFSGGPNEFRDAFDDQAAEIYGTSPLASSQILEVGDFDATASEVEPSATLALVPLVLLFGLWIGWAGPLAGEVRTRTPGVVRAALVRAAFASAITSLLLFVALGRGITWEFWNEANNVYWGTVYDTTAATPLPTWPNPVVFATWLTDSTFAQVAVVIGMAAWVVASTATLFLAATRVLLAAASDGVLPASVARTTGDTVPLAALALLVVPACALAALDAYWQAFAGWTAIAVVAFGFTMVGSGLAAVVSLRRELPRLAGVAAVFVVLVVLVIGVWLLDPVYGMRTFGAVAFLAALYAISVAIYAMARRRDRGPLQPRPTSKAPDHPSIEA
jgi:amino acid transporter